MDFQEKMTKISRRDLLKMGLAGAGALVLSAGEVWHYQKPTIANRLLRDFPETIPGAKSVEKHEIKGADKTLVHIRQIHEVEGVIPLEELLANTDYTPEDKQKYARMIVEGYREISSVQKDIYKILDFLIRNNDLKCVYSEGVLEEESEVVTSRANILCNNILQDVFSLGYFGKNFDDKARNLLYFIPGAKYILAAQGRIKIKGAELQYLNEGANKTLDIDNDLFDVTNELREETALEIISKSQDPLDILVYGGAHYFGNNINEWNKKHPDRKYSLIEITPESYGEKK